MRRLAALLFVVLAGIASPAPARAGLTDADYWAFADGDQLLFEVGADTQSVVAYLHERVEGSPAQPRAAG